jgi:hypothetical protein
VARRRPALLAVLAALCAFGLQACGDSLQDQPVSPSALEPLVMQDEYPVYWLGSSFHRLGITSIRRDPSGAYTIDYGNCTEGGENVCVTPLELITSPDNSFRPGGSTSQRVALLRGVRAVVAQGGNTIELPTGGVVVDLYANSPALARAAAETMVRINAVDLPGAPLPQPLPDTGFAAKPLLSQQPPVVPARLSAASG